MTSADLELPWPPSVNRYWRNVRGRVLISKEGREYRTAVCLRLAGEPFGFGTKRIAVSIHASPPDRRRRDLDNLGKAALDALQYAGIYADDSQIDHLSFWRLAPEPPTGRFRVVITEITP